MKYSVPSMCMVMNHREGNKEDAVRELRAVEQKLEFQLSKIREKLGGFT